MKRTQKSWLVAILLLIATGSFAVGQTPVGSGFTFQGKLDDAGQPADGTYNLEFQLYGDAVGGIAIGNPEIKNDVLVVDGRFTVELDFGSDVFDGDARWLQVEVENIVLTPRQPVTGAPYSIQTRGIFADSDEDLGVGTTNPIAKLHVVGNGTSTAMRVSNGGPGGTAIIAGDVTGTGKAASFYGITSSDLLTAHNDGTGRAALFNGDVRVTGGDVEMTGELAVGPDYLTVGNDGFVGVGRDFPLATTEVFGVYKNTNGFAGMIMETNPGGAPYYGYTTNGGQAEAHHYLDGDTGMWHLWNRGERLSIGNDGYVGIGRDTPIVPNNSYFDVQTPAGNNQFGGMHMATVGEGGIPYYGYAAGGTTDAFTYFNGGTRTWGLKTLGIERMTVTSNGRIGISTFTPGFLLEVNGSAGKPGGGSWSNSSDRRLKKNVEGLDGSLEKLMKLRGVSYEYIDPKAINELEGERIGVIAQEVEKIFPDWVHQRDDGYKAVTFRGFEALTVEALRELRSEKDQQIETLEAENDELRERLETLEASVHSLMLNK